MTGLRYLNSNGSRYDNAEAQHEGSRNPDEKNEERYEGEQDTERRDKSYFVKVAQGKNGMSLVKGERESAADMERVMPWFCVKGIDWGVLGEEGKGEEQSGEDGDDDENDDAKQETKWYFYIQNFTPMRSPTTSDMQTLIQQLAVFHAKSPEKCSDLNYCGWPEGRFFGYHTTTHNGKLAQDNTWTTTWEEYFTRNMKRMLEYDEKEGGERSVEAEYLLEALFDKVMPRLLLPIEMYGRKVKPSLCHGDWWAVNIGVGEKGEVVVFDSGCFWVMGNVRYPIPRKLGRRTANGNIPGKKLIL